MIQFLLIFQSLLVFLSSLELSLLISSPSIKPIILTNSSDIITVTSDLLINQSFSLINPNSSEIYQEFLIENSQIQVLNTSNVSFQGFSFSFATNGSQNSFFLINNTNSFILQVFYQFFFEIKSFKRTVKSRIKGFLTYYSYFLWLFARTSFQRRPLFKT